MWLTSSATRQNTLDSEHAEPASVRLNFLTFDLGQTDVDGSILLGEKPRRAPDRIIELFNEMFADELSKCQVHNGVTWQILVGQYGMRTKAANWYEIRLNTSDEIERQENLRAILGRIEQRLATSNTAQISNERFLSGSAILTPRIPAKVSAQPARLTQNIAMPTSVVTPPRKIRLSGQKKLSTPRVVFPITPQSMKQPLSRFNYHTPSSPTPATVSVKPQNSAGTITSVLREQDLKKHTYVQPSGNIITLSETAITASVPIDYSLAHPSLEGQLLYRMWTKSPYEEFNSEHGFVARRYWKANIVTTSPPPAQFLDETDIFQHLSRASTEPSKFVSTTNRLFWVLGRGLKEVCSTGNDIYISIIDPGMMDNKAIYYAVRPSRLYSDNSHLDVRTNMNSQYPWHRHFFSKRAYTAGTWRNTAKHEYLCWRNIPERAIISTFSVKEFVQRASVSLSEYLSLQVLSRHGNITTKSRNLSKDAPSLSHELNAEFVKLLGFSASSPASHIAFIIENLNEWGFRDPTSRDWAQGSDIFTRALERDAPTFVPTQQLQLVRLWYLYGLERFKGPLHWRIDAALTARMKNSAARVGLRDGICLLLQEMDGTKLHMQLHDRRQQRILCGNQSSLRPSAARSRFIEDEDTVMEDNSSDDNESVFEFKEGDVVA